MENVMYLVNDFKRHRTPLLNFISLIKVSRPFSEDKNGQYNFLTCFSATYRYFEKNLSSNKVVSQEIHKAVNNNVSTPICLEISIEKVNELLQNKQICAADIRCLDSGSKKCLMDLCLQNCLTGK